MATERQENFINQSRLTSRVMGEAFDVIGGNDPEPVWVTAFRPITFANQPIPFTKTQLKKKVENLEKVRDDLTDIRKPLGDLIEGLNDSETILATIKAIPNPTLRKIISAVEISLDTGEITVENIYNALQKTESALSQKIKFLTGVDTTLNLISITTTAWDQTRFALSKEQEVWRDVADATESAIAQVETDLIDTSEILDHFADRIEDRRILAFAIADNIDKIKVEIGELSAGSDPNVDPGDALLELFQNGLALIDQAVDAVKNLDLEDIGAFLSPITSATRVLDKVRKVVQPVIDFFGPVTSFINKAIDKVEKALGLNTLEDRIKASIQSVIDSVVGPIEDQIESITEKISDAISSVLGPILEFYETLSDQLSAYLTGRFANSEGSLTGDRAAVDLSAGMLLIGGDFDDTLNLNPIQQGNIIDPTLAAFGMAIGGEGNDTITGNIGKDLLNGGTGNDEIFGGDGDDQLFGGDGDDTLNGEGGDDEISGDGGDDALIGGDGNDLLTGGTGNDTLTGDDGNDTLFGDDGEDDLTGGAGNDTLRGGAGEDTLRDGSGNNDIDGGEGFDTIITTGSSSATHQITDSTAVLIGGAGQETLILGDDFSVGTVHEARVEFDAGANTDAVEAGSIDLSAFGSRFTNFEELRILAGTDAKTVVGRAADYAPFDELVLSGTSGSVTLEVPDGLFDMNALLGSDQAFLFNISGMMPTQNPQDGVDAGVTFAPTSSVIALTVALQGAGEIRGLTNVTQGLTFVGSAEDDTLIGGGGSDILRPGAGADIIDGGASDRGDRFKLDGASGDVIIGSAADLDGDTIRNLTNRVDSVRLEGANSHDYVFEETELEGATLIRVFASETEQIAGLDPISTFTLEGDYPKLASDTGSYENDLGERIRFFELFNNNIPPTANGEVVEGNFQTEGGQIITPFDNDFDADTPADSDAGIMRREIDLPATVARLFTDGMTVPTALGNLIRATEVDGAFVFTYEARNPELELRRFDSSDAIAGSDNVIGKYDVTEDLPFFGLDRLDYQVLDFEGELSNEVSLTILLRPELVDGTGEIVGLPSVTVFGEGDEEFAATLNEIDGTEGTRRIRYDSDSNLDLATAVGGADLFDIGRIQAEFDPTAHAFFGFEGNDVVDGRGATGDLILLGGNGADWVEGGDFNDFLSGGGLDDEIIIPSTRVAGDGLAPVDEDAAPNILIGGGGLNVYSASVDHPAGGIDTDFTQSRESVYVLDADGVDIITGPLVTVGQSNTTLNLDLVPVAGPTALAATALDGDTIIGFDRNNADLGHDFGHDQIVLPLDSEAFRGVSDDISVSKNLTVSTGLLSNPSLDVIVSATLQGVSSGLTLTESRDDLASLQEYIFVEQGISPLLVGASPSQLSFPTQDPTVINLVPFLQPYSLERVVTYEVSVGSSDGDGGRGSSTTVSVTFNAYETIETLELYAEAAGIGTVETRLDIKRELVQNDALIDPLDLDGASGLTFTFELEGIYQDRFTFDLAELSVAGDAFEVLNLTDARNGRNDVSLDDEVLFFDNLGISISYVSAPPVANDDLVITRDASPAVFDVVANDTDADGDALKVFDLVFENADDEARLLDGDTANGELIQQTDPEDGLGTGVMTYVGAAGELGDLRVGYIATDGEFQADPAWITLRQTGLPPSLGDDRIVLTADSVSEAVVAFTDLLANDVDPEGDPIDPTNLTVSVESAVIGGIAVNPADISINPDGVVIGPSILALLATDPVNQNGEAGATLELSYTLEDTAGGGTSEQGQISISIAAPLQLTDPTEGQVAEDSKVFVDLTSLRDGGFGKVNFEIVSVVTTEGLPAGTAQVTARGITFTPLEDLSDTTALIIVDVRDATGASSQITVPVAITPVADAPIVLDPDSATALSVQETVEDTELTGQFVIVDPDPGDLALLLSSEPVSTSEGGKLVVTPTLVPGRFDYTYSPAPDFEGEDLATIDLVPGSDGVVSSVSLSFAVAAVNDAPTQPADSAVVLGIGGSLRLPILEGASDVDSEIDPDSIQITGGGAEIEWGIEPGPDDSGPVLVIDGLASGTTRLEISIVDVEGMRGAPRVIDLEVNAPPVAETDALEVTGNAPILIDAIANDFDDDGTVSYLRDTDGTPVILDAGGILNLQLDDVTGEITEIPDAPSLLGVVEWSEPDGAFLYTPPTDPELAGQTDVFYYLIQDDDGSTSQGAVLIDIIDDGVARLRLDTTEVIELAGTQETVVAAADNARFVGTLSEFDGDEILAFREGTTLIVSDVSSTDLTLSVSRSRTDGLTSLDVVAVDGLPTLEGVLGVDSVDALNAAFLGSTILTLTDDTGSASVTLPGALTGDFAVTDGPDGIEITYSSSPTSTSEDDDLRGRTEADVIDALGGDDLITLGAGDDTGSGGAGRDVLLGQEGLDALTGGEDADLFVITGEGTDTLSDFNPFEGDRIVITDGRFLTDDQKHDFNKLELRAGGDEWLIVGLPEDAPEEVLVRFTLPDPVAFNGLDSELEEDSVISGLDLVALVTGADGAFSFEVVTAPANGTVEISSDGLLTYAPDADFNGADSIEVRVTLETAGGPTERIASFGFNVIAVDDAPEANDATILGTEDIVLTGAVLATDVDGDAITYAVATGPASGGLELLADGSWTYTPDEDFNGIDGFNFTANSGGLSDTGTITLDIGSVNDTPVALDDTGFASESGAPLLFDAAKLLANDSDVDGDALQIVSVASGSGGTATLTADGNVSFMADTDFSGEASFTYQISDGSLASNMAAVTIAVEEPMAEFFVGTDGNDRIRVTDVMNTNIFGAGGNDVLVGAGSNDQLLGGDGRDYIRGRNGDDLLDGGNGNDVIFGGRGSDTVAGGANRDYLFGGRDDDSFVFTTGDGSDTILDFSQSQGDQILIDIDGIDTFEDMMATATTSFYFSTRFDLGDGDVLLVARTRTDSFTSDDFVFV